MYCRFSKGKGSKRALEGLTSLLFFLDFLCVNFQELTMSNLLQIDQVRKEQIDSEPCCVDLI